MFGQKIDCWLCLAVILIVHTIISQMPTSTNINLSAIWRQYAPAGARSPASMIGLGTGQTEAHRPLNSASTGDQNKIKLFQLLINKTTNADMQIN